VVQKQFVEGCPTRGGRASRGKRERARGGNIQYDDFRSLEPEQMESMVRRTLAEGRGGRFILSPTAGPYEPWISARMQRKYVRFLEAGVKYGRA
jgi:hypothetical protein